jgi:enediyne biosynthesis protein E4
VTHTAEALAANERFRLQQRRQLFRNIGMGRFEEITDRAGPAFTNEDVGRGAAFGDLDNDGDTDIVVANDNGPVRVLINAIGSRSHWIGLRLLTSSKAGLAEAKGKGGRDALGARVMIATDGGPAIWRRARADGSYGSANDSRVLIGLGATAATSVKVQVFWPGGRSEEWSGLPVNRYTTLVENTGTTIPTSVRK